MNEITAIMAQVKDKTRCNVYIDNRFCCGMRMDTVVKNRLKVGSLITEEKLAELQLESEKDAAFDKALTHLSATRKTEKQIRDFLAKKGYLPAVIDYAVEKLRSYDFINDGEYAEAYVESAAKRKGERLMRMELISKGLSEEEIAGALEKVDENTQISSAAEIARKYLRGKTWDKETFQKAYRYLLSKGFSYDVIKAALSLLGEAEEEMCED